MVSSGMSLSWKQVASSVVPSYLRIDLRRTLQNVFAIPFRDASISPISFLVCEMRFFLSCHDTCDRCYSLELLENLSAPSRVFSFLTCLWFLYGSYCWCPSPGPSPFCPYSFFSRWELRVFFFRHFFFLCCRPRHVLQLCFSYLLLCCCCHGCIQLWLCNCLAFLCFFLRSVFFQIHIFVQFRGFFLLTRDLRLFQLSLLFHAPCTFAKTFISVLRHSFLFTACESKVRNNRSVVTPQVHRVVCLCIGTISSASFVNQQVVQLLVFHTGRSEDSLLVGSFLAVIASQFQSDQLLIGVQPASACPYFLFHIFFSLRPCLSQLNPFWPSVIAQDMNKPCRHVVPSCFAQPDQMTACSLKSTLSQGIEFSISISTRLTELLTFFKKRTLISGLVNIIWHHFFLKRQESILMHGNGQPDCDLFSSQNHASRRVGTSCMIFPCAYKDTTRLQWVVSVAPAAGPAALHVHL